jgi:glycosyltransferase 2 family protein
MISARKKDLIYVFLRIFISLLLLLFIILKNLKNFIGIFNSILNLNSVFIALAIIVFILSLFLESIRWQIILRAHGTRINIGYLFISFMIANFYNNLLPSTIGGDFYRTYDISKNKNISINHSISAVFIERFLGLIAITIYFLITSFSIYSILKKSIIVIAIFLGIAFILFTMVIKPNLFSINKLFKKFKKLKRAEEKFYSFNEILNSYKHKFLYLCFGMIANFGADLFIVFSYYLLS